MHCRPDMTISLETAMLAAIDRLDHQQSHCPSPHHCHYALLQKWPFPAPHHQCECSLRNALPKLSCKTEHALLLMLPRAVIVAVILILILIPIPIPLPILILILIFILIIQPKALNL